MTSRYTLQDPFTGQHVWSLNTISDAGYQQDSINVTCLFTLSPMTDVHKNLAIQAVCAVPATEETVKGKNMAEETDRN